MDRRIVEFGGRRRLSALPVIMTIGAVTIGWSIDPAWGQAVALGINVLYPPRAVVGTDDATHLVYELGITNGESADTITPTRVVISDAASGREYADFSDDAIRERLRIPGHDLGETEIPHGEWGAFFVHVAIPPGVTVPTRLRHTLTYSLDSTPGQTRVGGETQIDTAPPVVFGPPLRGSGYVAGDGCCDAPRHVMALLHVGESWWNAQRYAIDWEQLDDQNRLWVPPAGREPTPEDFHIYGKDILAVADGTVVETVDGLPDQPPHHPDVPIEQADGNHVILDVGGLYVLYAHLVPKSVVVEPGQRMRKGQVLGKVGNSGYSTAPHLHLQAMDRPASLAANGVPYVFEAIDIQGFDPGGSPDFQDAEDTGRPATITPVSPPAAHTAQLPMNVTVVDWLN